MSIISLPSINYFSSFKFKGCHILNCRELISDIKFKKKKGGGVGSFGGTATY
jgi:hypothetical protein